MARLVLDKFGDLTDNFSSPHARRKVLAGVVMTTGMAGELHPGRGGGFQGCQNPVSTGGRHGEHSLSGPSSVLVGPVSAEGPVGEHPCSGVRDGASGSREPGRPGLWMLSGTCEAETVAEAGKSLRAWTPTLSATIEPPPHARLHSGEGSLVHLPLWEASCCSPACSPVACLSVARRC